ncbi:MAG: nucleotidyltransferase domain-containing protein [Chloroflexota bacterium]
MSGQPEQLEQSDHQRPNMALAKRFLQENGPNAEVLLCSITGSHTYGFASPDSDIDIKGIHIVPTEKLLLLNPKTPPHDRLEIFHGVECDLTTHEVAQALGLLLRGNGNVLERILSSYQLLPSPHTDALQELAQATIHRGFAKHYMGYFRGMQREHQLRRHAKSALYTYRVALTGMHLLRSGELVTDVQTLAADTAFTNVAHLVAHKQQMTEKVAIPADLDSIVEEDWSKLEVGLAAALDESKLPNQAPNQAALEEWLLTLRRERF